MKTIKIVGIVALAIALIVIIIWAVRESMESTDVVTGVKESKIKKAAESVGIPAKVAVDIAKAPDSGTAARRIGVPVVLATAIANGIELPPDVQARTIPTNKDGNCPSGYVRYGNSKSGYYCKALAGKDLSSMA